MRLQKPSTPPLNHFSNVPSSLGLKYWKLFPKKKDAGGGGGKEKHCFFFFATATPQIKRASLETQVEKRITIDCLHYFHSGEKYINTIKSDMIYTDGGAQNKSPLASSQTRTGLKKWRQSVLLLQDVLSQTHNSSYKDKLNITPIEWMTWELRKINSSKVSNSRLLDMSWKDRRTNTLGARDFFGFCQVFIVTRA